MPWQPLPRIAFAVATYPFAASGPADLPLEIGDELYVIEETPDGNWLRGYLVAPPSLLAGLTSVKGQTLEARVFSGVFPRSHVEVREMLGESEETDDAFSAGDDGMAARHRPGSDSAKSGILNGADGAARRSKDQISNSTPSRKPLKELTNGTHGKLSIPVQRDPNAPRPAAPVPMLKIGDETPTSAAEPLVDEISSCLREWHSKNLHELLLSRQYSKLNKMSDLITRLNYSRQQFLYNVLTAREYERLREKTVWDLVATNKLCGCEVIVRDPNARGRVLTGDDSVVEVTKLQSVMSLLDEPPQPTLEQTTLKHLLVEVKGFAGSSTEKTELLVYLVSKTPDEKPVTLSEAFSIDIPSGGSIGGLAQGSQAKTLFTELSANDIGDVPSAESELYLVAKVIASQQVAAQESSPRSSGGGPSTQPKDSPKPPSAGGPKGSRRSLMWGTKSSRSAFSRGGPVSAMGTVSEAGERPSAQIMTADDGQPAPGTSTSRANGAAPPPSQTAQRVVGVGVLKLNAAAKRGEGIEQVINIWSQAPRFVTDKESREDWDPLIQDLMDSSSGFYERSRRGERLNVHVKIFSNPDADVLIKSTPTLLSGVSKTSRIGFSGAPTRPRSDIYLTLSGAALGKQNLLSRFGGSAVNLPVPQQGANLQISVEVRNASGERLERCIYASSNGEALSTFKSIAADRGEQWHQTIRLSVPENEVAGAHVVMLLADMPHAPFAIAHLPLWAQDAFIRDGLHGLFLYKLDDNTSTAQPGPSGKGGYMSLPWTAPGRTEHAAELSGGLATLLVNSFLCSTRFSQDRVILGLLKWRTCSQDHLPELLRQLIFVPEIEVVKILSEVLDALFAIIVEHSGNDEHEDLVFKALVRVLGIVHDRRFNLGPLVDQYAEHQFKYPFATPGLIRSFNRLLENPTDPDTARTLRATFKVVRHILMVIARAHQQQKIKEADIGISKSTNGFSRQLRTIFKALDRMMRNSAPVLVGSQTLAVQHFHSWLPELTGLMSNEEILHVAIDFVDSCTNVKGKLILYKLILIINYSKLAIFSHPEQQSALSANTVRWIAPHWGHIETMTDQWREQIRLCCSVLASQAGHLGTEIPDHIPKIVDSYLAILSSRQKPRNRLSLLFPTSYPFPTKNLSHEYQFDEALAELSAVLSALSTSSSGMQLELADGDLTTVLENLLRVHMSILTGEAFPSDWLSVHIYHHKSTMHTLQYLSNIMLESFLPDPDEAETFNTELWKSFFATLLKLVGSPSLALETFPEQKRRAVWKIAGDVREHGAELLRKMWEAIGWETTPDERARYGVPKIGGYQVQYVPTLVGPIVELCLSVHEGLRKMAVEVLQTMIISEWTLSEDLSVVQAEMIDSLERLFKSRPLTESTLQKLFIGELLERFELLTDSPDEPLTAALQDLVNTLEEFLDLLVAVYSGDEGSSEVSNIINRLRLMEFLRDMQKEEIFIRYVHQMAVVQAESRNHAEAGLALRLHADLYEWDPLKQTGGLSDPDFPPQTHFERKERIYFDMIKHFEEGQSWSNALTAYKELQQQYETNVFDFAKLARTERAIATIYETISKSDKLVPRYYKVIYKGLGFPASVRDKEFIYEGLPSERASGFTDRMQEQYPAAQIITSGEVDEVEGQFLVVSTVTPHRDTSHQVFQRARVPQVIRDFLLSSHPQTFSVSTKRVTSGPAHEHYAEKLVITTAEPFPTILRRSEIIDTQSVRLTAHETALERVVRKTQEMAALERRVAEGDEENAQLLVDAVGVSVNPASENSVACYRNLLPHDDEDEDSDSEEDQAEKQLDPQDNAIRMALVDHAMMLKRCLTLFARSNKEALISRHEELHSYYEHTFAPEIALFAPPPLPLSQRDPLVAPTPPWRSPSPTVEQSPQRPNIGSILNGGVEDEDTAVVQSVGVRQRGTRLSFLGGKKSSPSGAVEQGQFGTGLGIDQTSYYSPSGKENRRHSMLRSQSQDDGGHSGSASASASEYGNAVGRKESMDKGRVSTDSRGNDKEKEGGGGGIAKRAGSVRKRLSMLTMSKKSSRGNGLMGSLNEE